MGHAKSFFALILGIFLLVCVNSASAVIYIIDSCQTLSTSNSSYYLNGNVAASVSSSCFNTTDGIENIVINGNGFTITINGGGRAFYFRNNNNITLENVSIVLPRSSLSTSFGFDIANIANLKIANCSVNGGKGYWIANATNIEILNNTFVGGVHCFHNNITKMTMSGNIFNKTANIGGGYDTYIVQFGSSGTNGFVNDSVISGNTLSTNSSGTGISFTYARTKNIDVGYNFIRTVGHALTTGSYFNATHMSESYGYFRIHDNNIITSNGSYSSGVCLFIYATGETLDVIAENNNVTCGGSYGIYVQLDTPSRTGKNVSSILFRGNRYNLTQPFAGVGLGMLNVYKNLTIGSVIIDGENTVSPAYNYGIMLRNITVTVNNSRFDGLCNGAYLRGFSVYDVYNTVFNSYVCPLTNTSTGSVKTSDSAILNCYNCNMNDTENISAIDASQVNVFWSLAVLNPLGADVSIYDNQDSLVSEFSGDNSLWLRQFFANASGRADTTPHRIEASKEGYLNLTAEITMDGNKQITLDMNPINIGYYCDFDGDGYKSNTVSVVCGNYSCVQTYSGICSTMPGDDYNDTNPNVNPAATEICNGIDDNCNGRVDENDQTPPTTASDAPSGWKNSDVHVILTATDEGGCGVQATYYCVDQTNECVPGTPGTEVTVAQEGTNYVRYSSIDESGFGDGGDYSDYGNVEAVKSDVVRLDKTAPTIIGSRTPEPNAKDWNNVDITVHFDCGDELSGVETCTSDILVSAERASQAVDGKVTDKAGNSATTTVSGINIDKTSPTITIVTPTGYGLYMVGTSLDFSASDSLSGVESVAGYLTNTFGAAQEVPSGFKPEPGVYTLVAKAYDNAGNYAGSEPVYFVVYDPNGGFATGGGWIAPDSESTLPGGRANFGFVAKYKSGASSGNLEFQYKDADINLKSTSIDWLVISGTSAQFQGRGTINGEGLYTFRVLAKDNGEPGAGTDHFDIRIWSGTSTEAGPIHKAKNVISGGNILVHKK